MLEGIDIDQLLTIVGLILVFALGLVSNLPGPAAAIRLALAFIKVFSRIRKVVLDGTVTPAEEQDVGRATIELYRGCKDEIDKIESSRVVKVSVSLAKFFRGG